jgi:hypothetical protein
MPTLWQVLPFQLSHYDPNKESIVSADASSFGIGAVIRQKRGESLRPVAYASRSMSDTEMRYAQIEKEALAITWACEKFSQYQMMMHPLKQCFLYSDHNDLMSRKKQAHALSAGMHFLGPCSKSTRYLLSVIHEAASSIL